MVANSHRRQPVAASALPADPCPRQAPKSAGPSVTSNPNYHPSSNPRGTYSSQTTSPRNTLPQPHDSNRNPKHTRARKTPKPKPPTMPRTKSPSRSSTASTSGNSAKTATKRLIKEMDTWRKEQREEKGIERLGPTTDENLLEWEAVINGRGVGAGYDGTSFSLLSLLLF